MDRHAGAGGERRGRCCITDFLSFSFQLSIFASLSLHSRRSSPPSPPYRRDTMPYLWTGGEGDPGLRRGALRHGAQPTPSGGGSHHTLAQDEVSLGEKSGRSAATPARPRALRATPSRTATVGSASRCGGEGGRGVLKVEKRQRINPISFSSPSPLPYCPGNRDLEASAPYCQRVLYSAPAFGACYWCRSICGPSPFSAGQVTTLKEQGPVAARIPHRTINTTRTTAWKSGRQCCCAPFPGAGGWLFGRRDRRVSSSATSRVTTSALWKGDPPSLRERRGPVLYFCGRA